tara:strand:- start:4169 stop:4603 length:435 start_codon:yes stop_codon:yes gene_type:complete
MADERVKRVMNIVLGIRGEGHDTDTDRLTAELRTALRNLDNLEQTRATLWDTLDSADERAGISKLVDEQADEVINLFRTLRRMKHQSAEVAQLYQLFNTRRNSWWQSQHPNYTVVQTRRKRRSKRRSRRSRRSRRNRRSRRSRL